MDDEEDELALMRLERKAKLGEDVGATRVRRRPMLLNAL
jgi:hypothetical protein